MIGLYRVPRYHAVTFAVAIGGVRIKVSYVYIVIMSREVTESEELVRGLFDAFNEQAWERYGEVLADDVVLHESGADMHGPEAVIEHDKQFHENYPNAKITVADIVASDSRVAAREDVSADGLEASGILFSRVEDGQLAEIWVLTD